MSNPRPLRAWSTLGAAVLAAASCTSRTEEIRAHMKDHFDQAVAIHAAVTAGDLEATREPARWLAEHDPVEAPAAWDQYVATMKREATALLTAGDIQTAATAAANMIRTCGDCHGALTEGVTFTASPGPVPDPGLVPHMRRHQWAAERLWEGLAMPSVDAWNRGLGALDEAALTADQLQGDSAAVMLAERVHGIARSASGLTSWRARTDAYEQLIASCAACHQRRHADATG